VRQPTVSRDPLAPKRGVLAGSAAGLVGIFCCVGPAAAALLGALSAESAIDLATDLYGDWAWAFRLAGAAAGLAFIMLARRRAACAIGAPALKRFVSVLVVSALVTYGVLYGVTTWLGNVADGSGGSNGSAPAALSESASADSEPESALDRLRRLSGQACTPSRNYQTVTGGIGPLCLPFDAIRAIDDPQFVPVERTGFLPESEPVVAASIGGVDRAYPVRFLLYHEIVNDTVAGRPVVISFCPLCNSAVAHSRRVGGRVLTFGVSGQLVTANLVMFDRETLTLWQQITGEAFAGRLQGRRLRQLPVTMTSFADWRRAHPDGTVMARPKGTGIDYGIDPYSSYDRDPNEESRFFRPPPESGETTRTDPRLPPKWRVVGVSLGKHSVAFPSPERGRGLRVQTARLGRTRLVAFMVHGASLPERHRVLAEAPRGWSTIVYDTRLKGRSLDLEVRDGRFIETNSGSEFDFFGHAVSGPLRGRHLRTVPQETSFWFAWVYFHPETAVAKAGDG
jgi:hypothetical protein